MILRKGSAVAVIVRSGPERPSPAKGVLLEKKDRTRMILHRIADVMRGGRGSPTQIANDMNGSFKSEENLESRFTAKQGESAALPLWRRQGVHD